MDRRDTVRPLSCRDVADLIDEVALDNLSGERRAAALDHLEDCASCRTEVEQLAAIADVLLLACPSVEPPPGFDQRVMTAIRKDQRRRRPRLAAVAAAAAALVALFGGVKTAGQPGSHRVDETETFEAHELRTVSLTAAGGQQIGDVSAYTGSPAWFFMRVTHGDATATYRCVLDLDGGSSLTLGELFVSHGRGAWGQRINLNGHQVRSARVITANGKTVATAFFQ